MRIGIDLGGTKIEGITLENSGEISHRLRIATPQGDYWATIKAITQLVEQLETNAGHQATVGIGIPGSLSPRTGKVRNANSTCLIGQPLQQDLEKSLARPIKLANDADCFALSEATDGAGKEFNSVFGVIIGTGTGAGITINKTLLSGPNRIAGEWGHNPLPWKTTYEHQSTTCYCGKQDCIETFLSGPGFQQSYQRSGGDKNLTPKEIIDRAQKGDPLAASVFTHYQDQLARSLASIINILDPEVIILGGGMSKITTLYESIPQRWKAYVFSDTVNTQLKPPLYSDSSGVRGAAWLWPTTL